MNHFHENLTYYRKTMNMTQLDLAQEIHVTRQTISNYENNTRTCELDVLIGLSEVLHVSLDHLIKYPHP
jgi:DNA-binding XRE family transcriptional regulator|nr:MAG TPA: helix-turn-helix domain protein [Caudoviricetes sp.]